MVSLEKSAVALLCLRWRECVLECVLFYLALWDSPVVFDFQQFYYKVPNVVLSVFVFRGLECFLSLWVYIFHCFKNFLTIISSNIAYVPFFPFSSSETPSANTLGFFLFVYLLCYFLYFPSFLNYMLQFGFFSSISLILASTVSKLLLPPSNKFVISSVHLSVLEFPYTWFLKSILVLEPNSLFHHAIS